MCQKEQIKKIIFQILERYHFSTFLNLIVLFERLKESETPG